MKFINWEQKGNFKSFLLLYLLHVYVKFAYI